MGITAVIITHEMAVVEEICPTWPSWERGRMVETGTVEEVFSNPQTEAGRRLVFPEGGQHRQVSWKAWCWRCSTAAPPTSPSSPPLAIDCGVKVNILGADTRNVNGKAFGPCCWACLRIMERLSVP